MGTPHTYRSLRWNTVYFGVPRTAFNGQHSRRGSAAPQAWQTKRRAAHIDERMAAIKTEPVQAPALGNSPLVLYCTAAFSNYAGRGERI